MDRKFTNEEISSLAHGLAKEFVHTMRRHLEKHGDISVENSLLIASYGCAMFLECFIEANLADFKKEN